MRKRGRYYLGRIIKLGNFTQDKLLAALEKPTAVEAGAHNWTITGFKEFKEGEKVRYVFGCLNKYKPEAKTRHVDAEKRAEYEKLAPDMAVAKSPFVYIPEHSGIVYLHVWNQIEQTVFVKRFSDIVTATYEKFFVDCQIEAVADLRSFAKKLSGLEGIHELSAKINPPNPLFGPLWESLKTYLQKRQADEMSVDEKGKGEKPLQSKIQQHILGVLDADESGKEYRPDEPPDIGDAAILMAADGYGQGKVIGRQDGAWIVIKTTETIKSFLFEKEPDPEELFKVANELFVGVQKERHMKHDKR